MDLDLYTKIIEELALIQFKGLIAFSGFSEPLLHPALEELVIITKKYIRSPIAIHTNGIELDDIKLKFLKENNIYTVVSAYDEKIFRKFLYNKYIYIKYNHLKKISNRAGSLFKSAPIHSPCYYPFYTLFINYDGEVYFCPHNFPGYNSLGNIKNQNILSLWLSNKLSNIRKKLLKREREFLPCSSCNIAGTKMGKRKAKEWKNIHFI